MAKLFRNPKNGELNTAKHWAEEYEYKNANTFRVFANKCITEGRAEDAYCSKQERKKRGIEKSTEAPLYTNPTPNEKGEYITKTAKGWSVYFGMSKSGWMGRVRKFGENDPRTYESKEEANERKKEAISEAKKKDWDSKRGPKISHTMRRGSLAKVEVGTWEARHIPDK